MDARCSVEQPDYIPATAFVTTFRARVKASSGSGKRVGYWPLNLTLFTATFCQSKMEVYGQRDPPHTSA